MQVPSFFQILLLRKTVTGNHSRQCKPLISQNTAEKGKKKNPL